MRKEDITEDDWKVVKARLQQDIDNGKGDEIGMMFIGDKPSPSTRQEKK